MSSCKLRVYREDKFYLGTMNDVETPDVRNIVWEKDSESIKDSLESNPLNLEEVEFKAEECDIALNDLYHGDIVRAQHVHAGSAFVCRLEVKPDGTHVAIDLGPSSTPIQDLTALEKVGNVHQDKDILEEPERAYRKEV